MSNLSKVFVYVASAIAFSGYLYVYYGLDSASTFLNVFSAEYALSADNLAVFMMIFQFFGIPTSKQGSYLNWGILGACVMRAIFISLGAAVLLNFHWILYVLGGFLLMTAWKMWGVDEPEDGLGDKEKKVIHFVQNTLRVGPFLTVVAALELCDIWFAVDSIPVAFTVTQNPFIIWSANIFAIMGLRSLYFVVAEQLDKFASVKKYGVPAVLAFIALKILNSAIVEIPTWVALVVTVAILAGSTLIPEQQQGPKPINDEVK